MTIDEVIIQYEEMAEEAQKVVDTHYISDELTIDEIYCDDTEIIEERLALHQERADDFRQLAEWLKELKILREQTRWIPVSERLPENGELVLFSTKTGRVFEGGFYNDKTDLQWYAFRNREFVYNNVVTAWLPLPKSYKEEKESEE